jgi:hypothetical protein
MSNPYEEARYEQVQDADPIPVHIASSDATPTRTAAPEYAGCNTYVVDTVVNMGRPVQLLTKRYRRDKAFINIPSMSQLGTLASAQGQTVAPGAGASVATLALANIVPGWYNIHWTVSLAAGAPAAADVDNFRLKTGAQTLFTSTNPAALGEFPQPDYGPIFLNGQNNLVIAAVAAATAGVTYAANMDIIPVVQGTGAVMLVNSRMDPLTNPVNPQGFAIYTAPYQLEWRSQKPCWAVLTPIGNGPIQVSVIDYAYEES